MARSGMSELITELRGMAEAGTADYSLGASTFWSDDQLQDLLDSHRTDIIFQSLNVYPTVVSSGSASYKDYRSDYGYLETTTGGTAIMYLQDSTGATVGTANYTPDYRRGKFEFTADQRGTAYYLTGRSYDLNAAAADVWNRKAAHYAPTSFDFSTDNHSVSRSQIYAHCKEMAAQFNGFSGNSIQTISMYRGDM